LGQADDGQQQQELDMPKKNNYPATLIGRDGKRYPHWSRTPLFQDMSKSPREDALPNPERDAFVASCSVKPNKYGPKRQRFRLTPDEKLHVIKRRMGER
jgi:hypothetical protein